MKNDRTAPEGHRMIKGEIYRRWPVVPTMAAMAAYQAAGVRAVRRGTDLFIHLEDVTAAASVDARSSAAA